jgi:hypothetical protein
MRAPGARPSLRALVSRLRRVSTRLPAAFPLAGKAAFFLWRAFKGAFSRSGGGASRQDREPTRGESAQNLE